MGHVTLQVQQLQEEQSLSDSQISSDDKYIRVKQENLDLAARVHLLEEHIRQRERWDERRM